MSQAGFFFNIFEIHLFLMKEGVNDARSKARAPRSTSRIITGSSKVGRCGSTPAAAPTFELPGGLRYLLDRRAVACRSILSATRQHQPLYVAIMLPTLRLQKSHSFVPPPVRSFGFLKVAHVHRIEKWKELQEEVFSRSRCPLLLTVQGIRVWLMDESYKAMHLDVDQVTGTHCHFG